MQVLNCPKCGAAVTFQSNVAVFAVCPSCRATLVRHDVEVEAMGEMATLLPDLSPLQLGTQGEFDGVRFTLAGGMQMAYDEGSWTEWWALFDDGRQGWVAETQGFFLVSFETQVPGDLPRVDLLKPGHALTVDQRAYRVMDRKEATCISSAGELPMTVPSGWKEVSIDLAGPNGEFASVHYADGTARFFTGRYAEFQELKFENLKPVPGWSNDTTETTGPNATVLTCPQCGAGVTLRAAGRSVSAACDACGALLDASNPELQLIQTAQQRQRVKPLIPLGRRGVLFGINYEAIGFQHVKDKYSGWNEYLLFNPWQGFAWLVNYGGHWSFVRRLLGRPELGGETLMQVARRARFGGQTYRLFDAGPVVTDYVLGEFYWRVRVGMPVVVTDFVCPPRILSRETYPQLAEETWSQGQYIESDIIWKAFGLEGAPRDRFGVYLNQPNHFSEKGRQLAWITPLVILALFAIQFISASRAAREPVIDAGYTYLAGQTNATIVTEPFEIKGGNQALLFNFSAPVNNNWIAVDVDLVNADAHQAVASFEQGIEYYWGTDDGESWTEGTRTPSHVVPAVAPGRYYLDLEVSADRQVNEMPFKVMVIRDVVDWSNFWIVCGLVLLYPLYVGLRALMFENARWRESDYTSAGARRAAVT